MQVNAEKFELANRWIRLLNRRISILQRLRNQGIKKIIVYGASEFAMRLLEQCKNEYGTVEVIGICDKKISSKGGFYEGIPLLSMADIAELDMYGTCVIITAMGFYKEITDELQRNGIVKVMSLRDLIYDACC